MGSILFTGELVLQFTTSTRNNYKLVDHWIGKWHTGMAHDQTPAQRPNSRNQTRNEGETHRTPIPYAAAAHERILLEEQSPEESLRTRGSPPCTGPGEREESEPGADYEDDEAHEFVLQVSGGVQDHGVDEHAANPDNEEARGLQAAVPEVDELL